jgi:hypothetical protein
LTVGKDARHRHFELSLAVPAELEIGIDERAF